MTLSTCTSCGTPIRWVQAPGNPSRKAPPLEATGTLAHTIVRNELALITTYEFHECDPSRVEAWRKEMEQRRAEQKDWRELRDADYNVARTQVCPKCDAQPTEDCINLNVLKWKQIRQSVVIAHEERVELGYQAVFDN